MKQNYADLKFGAPYVKFLLNDCKTYCNGDNFLSITPKLLRAMNYNFGLGYFKLL